MYQVCFEIFGWTLKDLASQSSLYTCLVHFSAGIGRTGTVIVIDVLTHLLEERGDYEIIIPLILFQQSDLFYAPLLRYSVMIM